MRAPKLLSTTLSAAAALGLVLSLAPAAHATPQLTPYDVASQDFNSSISLGEPSVPVKQAKPGVDTTMEQARKAAGVTTGTAYPFDNPRNFEIPDPVAPTSTYPRYAPRAANSLKRTPTQ
ncbi:MAG TPA: hypothetical protein GX530_06050 [Corynebacteriales bacterium]|nr:hypothetical protein [Mycobacteriales bacterium]